MSYISSLNMLGDDPSIPISEEDVTDELALWANAQFKFDSTPGSALLDDPLKPTTASDCIYGVLNDFSSFDHHQQHPLVTSAANNHIEHQHHQQHQHPSLINVMPSSDLYSPTTPLTTPTFNMHSTDSLFANETTVDEPEPATQSTLTTSSHEEDVIITAVSNPGPVPKTKTGLDEDKRRRNTAASARFRQKKKLREQALQQTVKEMTAKTEALEKRCQELELEAKWLRALLVEKNPTLVTPLSTTCSSSLKA